MEHQMHQETQFSDALGWLKTLGPVAHEFRMDANLDPLEALQQELIDLTNEMETIVARADAEDRDLTDDEQSQLASINAEFAEKTRQFDSRKVVIEAKDRALEAYRVGQPTGRQTQPDGGPVEDEPEPEPQSQPQARAPEPQAQGQASRPKRRWDPSRRVAPEPIDHADRGRNGFRHFGEFAMAVKDSIVYPHKDLDPRLIKGAAASTVSTEGVGADGGFAVPPEWRQGIAEKGLGEESLLPRTDQQQTTSNVYHLVKDETTDWQSSGGIQAAWTNELGALAQSKVNLTPSDLRLDKLTVLVPASDELLEDAAALGTHITTKAPRKIAYKVSDAIYSGTGAGQPQGILTSGATISVAKESGQAADTILFANISKMYTRMPAVFRQNAVWLINQDIEVQLDSLNHPGDSSPVWMPAGGLADAPFGRLKGRPVVPHQACKTLGDLGDIAFVDLMQYLSVQKVGGPRFDTSIHLWFDQDITAFRFILRIAGQPWHDAAFTPANGSNTLSPFVVLAERA
jgi:HK97 family phage major capsid protein